MALYETGAFKSSLAGEDASHGKRLWSSPATVEKRKRQFEKHPMKLIHHKIIKFVLMTVEQLYKDFTDQLKNIYEEREAANITDWVFESIAGIKRLDRIATKHKKFNNFTIEQLTNKLGELLQHKPVQYVLEEAWFCKMKFFVNSSVLIPRPETEELVEWVVSAFKNNTKTIKIIDVGTGSGCIAIALKKQLTAAAVLGIDVSAAALSVARNNALTLNADIEFLQINFLEENEWDKLDAADIIISNPPYIPENEKAKMQKNVLEFEPHLALFPGEADPFIFYKKLALFANQYLNKDGLIYVEVHEGSTVVVGEIFARNNLKSIYKNDIYGRDRMVSAHRC